MTPSEREEVEKLIGEAKKEISYASMSSTHSEYFAEREFNAAVNRWREKQDAQPNFTSYTRVEWRTEL